MNTKERIERWHAMQRVVESIERDGPPPRWYDRRHEPLTPISVDRAKLESIEARRLVAAVYVSER
jgi:hypothetical protein